ncbi:P-loop containing nucleoside triphosphate hydrolase protein [Lanmaoa asiatica]|nr:P-loop containing nucleoside triphosphate hydrolase protein [Lanmaoa asiatica]
MSALSATQRTVLAKGGFREISDVLLATASDISRACKIPPHEANKIISLICREHAQPLRPLQAFLPGTDESFTTGDSELDSILGGGVTTGMVWEVVGESAAGKTQLALQLSLLVQLPHDLGGISGSACYITIASHLQTSRLQQILDAHPLLSPSFCTFSDVQTVQTPTIPRLIHILSTFLPQYIDTASKNPTSKPLKLLIIDPLAELFHSVGKTTTKTLVERSRQISEISSHLHRLANKYRIAVLVLNEVIDVIDRDGHPGGDATSYRDQSRLFGRANSVPGEDRKEAALGLVWANQVNARIFLTRTGRRRYLDENETPKKRSAVGRIPASRIAIAPVDDQPALVRRLSVVFSSVAAPASCDYIVTAEGISVIPGSTVALAASHARANQHPATSSAAAKGKQKDGVAPLDAGYVADNLAAENSRPPTPENELGPTSDNDEWDSYWAQNSLPDDAFTQIDSPGALPTSNA